MMFFYTMAIIQEMIYLGNGSKIRAFVAVGCLIIGALLNSFKWAEGK